MLGSEEQEKETAQFSVLTLQWRSHWSQRISALTDYHTSSTGELPLDILEKGTWKLLKSCREVRKWYKGTGKKVDRGRGEVGREA